MRYRIAGHLILATALFVSPAYSAVRCEKPSKLGIKRCEEIFQDKDRAKPPWKVIYYSQHNEIIDWEVNFPKDVDQLYPIVMIGASMAILHPTMEKEERYELFKRLVGNTAKQPPGFIQIGRYEWTSAKLGENYVFRATLRK
ncbi:MAG: hypothetical protein QOJ84_5258 [Bradyrhizobium sp.]|jgi:hypothetical protein|nr:hypothetical protein [Bradyrhizobium sp.]